MCECTPWFEDNPVQEIAAGNTSGNEHKIPLSKIIDLENPVDVIHTHFQLAINFRLRAGLKNPLELPAQALKCSSGNHTLWCPSDTKKNVQTGVFSRSGNGH